MSQSLMDESSSPGATAITPGIIQLGIRPRKFAHIKTYMSYISIFTVHVFPNPQKCLKIIYSTLNSQNYSTNFH